MPDKSLEQYNDPKEYNDIGLTFNVTGTHNKQYNCHADTYRETALNLVEQEFSNNVVDHYNQMIATRQAELESAENKNFHESSIVRKAYAYYDSSTLYTNNTSKKMDNINIAPSSIYMDLAIASAINQRQGKEKEGALYAASRCQGIARTQQDHNKAFSPNATGYIPPETTIEYFDNLYAQNNMGSVKVDLATKNDLAQHIQDADVHKGSRIVCDVEETRHSSSVVVAVKKDKQEGYDFYEVVPGRDLRPLKVDNPRDKSAIEKAQEAINREELEVLNRKLSVSELSSVAKSTINVEYDYVLKETREYMYTGVNAQNEPTFSRLTINGGDLNVPLSELPITKTHAVIDHTNLCLAKAAQEFDNSVTLKPEDLRSFVPNLVLSYSLPQNKAAQFDDPSELQSKAKMVFENIYNEHNPEIKELILAQNMKDDHERAMDLADNRSRAVQTAEKEAQNVNEEPVLAMKDNNKILSMAQNRNGGRS